MENNLEQEIRNLAYDMWRSAENEFGHALDFWAMAEQMVIEMTADSARRANAIATSAVETAAAWPSALHALYLYRTRELAHNMWMASNERRNQSLDYWLAAEKHLNQITESIARAAGASIGREETLVKTFETFSPVSYLEQIRTVAYQLWETAGRQYGSALDFWLAAEEKIFESLNPANVPTILEKTKQPEHPKRTLKPRQPRQPKTE